jgi:PilZ domain
MSVLEGTERMARESASGQEPYADDKRQSPRLPAPKNARCLIRMGNNTDNHGTYLVRLRDISTTGLGFNSAQTFAPGTRCTIALQDHEGHGLVCAAGIVWCKQIDEQLHDVGIQFDQPIDAARFAAGTAESPDSPEVPDIPC